MRFNYCIILLIFLPFTAISNQILVLQRQPPKENTVTRSISDEAEPLQFADARQDYPTQIIRLTNNLSEQQISCQQVLQEIDKNIITFITADKFMRNFFMSCTYDPKTKYATHFSIDSSFDPLNDEAIAYLNTYLAQYNGIDFLGTKLKIEAAKGLIVSLTFSAGLKKNPQKPPFIVYRQDHSNFYFKSNYDLRQQLLTDIKENLYTNDQDKILPFLDRWLFVYAGAIYKIILRDSDYLELQPERIFLMGDGDELYEDGFKFYFSHSCLDYTNHRCLDPSHER